jgi:N-acetylglucosamine-6-phosphate deacetylase
MSSPSGYVDLQVNGYAGVDFNTDDLSPDDLHGACERLRADGVAAVLATVITADLDRMVARLGRLAKLREADPLVAEVIAGFHIEGPFINPQAGYVGAHPPKQVRPANLDDMQRLLDATQGLTRMVTLAPEHDADFKVTRFLAKQKVIISAGHCDSSLDMLRGAIDAGVTMFTHLGNGCPTVLPRHDNIIGRVLSLADKLWICFIADGAHIPFFVLANYLRIVGLDRTICVTDAINAAGMGPGRYQIGDVTSIVGEDLVPRAADGSGQLAGSSVTMPRTAQNLQQHLGLSAAEIESVLVKNPRRALAL